MNPNKYLFQDDGYIDGYRQLIQTLEEMLFERGVTNYKVQRVDIRVDNYDNDFAELYKINNIIINILARLHDIENCYQSLANGKIHNIIARSKAVEVECYDRITKEGMGIAKTRLEFRTKYHSRNAINIEELCNVVEYWKELMSSPSISILYRQFQDEQNRRIVEEYQKNDTNNSIAQIILQNRNAICTSKQMTELCQKLGSNAKTAYKYKQRAHIKYYSWQDINTYLSEVAQALEKFMNKT